MIKKRIKKGLVNNKMERKSGVLLHITSLPSEYGVGTLGKSAYDFVDFLKNAGQTYWQVLPLCQTGYGDSPYQSCSAFSLNPYFIDFEILTQKGLLCKVDYDNVDFGQNQSRVDFEKLFHKKFDILKIAFSNFNKNEKEFCEFKKDGKFFDYAIFMSLKYKFGQKVWQEWDYEYKTRDKKIIDKYVKENSYDIDFWQFVQYECLLQWRNLKLYADQNGIKIIGDMPIYVSSDSVEVWTQNGNFLLSCDLYPSIVAGCPPDAFSSTGQLWGNPIYDWIKMKNENFVWWQNRLINSMELFDTVRIDHFRGFSSYYTVRYGSLDAKTGEWNDGYGESMFELFKSKIENLNIIAEDLGYIDDKAREMFRTLGFPGMKVMLFAFDQNDENEHLPSNYTDNYVAYIGTHDNEPLMAFIKENLSEEKFVSSLEKQLQSHNISLYSCDENGIADAMIELMFASKASTCIVTMQDLLKEGAEARMNLPATVSTDNWSYKLQNNSYKKLAKSLCELTEKYDRK